MRKWLADRSAVVLLVTLALFFNVAHFVFSWWFGHIDAEAHGQAFSSIDVWVEFLKDTAENLQSEMWQVVAAAVVFKWLRYVGSPEDKES